MLPTEPQCLSLPSFEDHRGRFQKVFHRQLPDLADFQIEQINWVQNLKQGTLRGLHYQTGIWAEAKLFRVLKGKIQLITANPERKGLFKSFILGADKQACLVPPTWATGYLCLEDNTEVLYLSNQAYAAQAEAGLRYDDPAWNITWLEKPRELSEKDLTWPYR